MADPFASSKASASSLPAPAPGSAALGPTLSPGFSPFASPKVSSVREAQSLAMTLKSNATPALTPPSDTVGAPTTNSGIRLVLTSSTASALCSSSLTFLLAVQNLSLVTHFVGCKPCGKFGDYPVERCMKLMD